MDILVLKTDIKTKKKVKAVTPVFDNHPGIVTWSVDTMDVDNVLRIESPGGLSEADVIRLVRSCGFHCEELPE